MFFYYKRIRSYLFATLLVMAATPGAALSVPLTGQITIDPANPSWFVYYGGGPHFLAAPGDPEDFLYRGSRNTNGTRNGDQLSIINKLKATGANGVYLHRLIKGSDSLISTPAHLITPICLRFPVATMPTGLQRPVYLFRHPGFESFATYYPSLVGGFA